MWKVLDGIDDGKNGKRKVESLGFILYFSASSDSGTLVGLKNFFINKLWLWVLKWL